MRYSERYSLAFIRSVLRDLVMQEPAVRLGQGGTEVGPRPPAGGEQRRRVEHLQRHAVGLGAVEDDLAAVADDFRDQVSHLRDRVTRRVTDVDRRLAVVVA